MASFWDNAWSAITGAFDVAGEKGATSNGWLTNVGDAIGKAGKWMENNKEATNLLGNTLLGVGSYFAQKEANKDLMRMEREKLNLQDELKSKYSSVPDVDISYNSLTVDNSPGLANGGILTEMKKKMDSKNKGI
nr:MAG TPA: hypothetical protein [Caudoviricetes sp.]